jgi:hypothetical protein
MTAKVRTAQKNTEDTMRKVLVTMTAVTAILGGGWRMSTAQAGPTASRPAIKADNAIPTMAGHYSNRSHRWYVVRRSSNQISSFSSSSGVGVNHPPKK